MRVIKHFIKQKETLIGISAAVAFQLIFVIVWLTGYDGVDKRTDQFIVGVVNEDVLFGEQILKGLKDDNVFQVAMYEDVQEGNQNLNDRSIQMLIHLPTNMTERLQANENSQINYYINQSSPTLTKQVMETTATKLNDQINQHIQEAMNQQLVDTIPQLVAAESTNKEVAQKTATQAVKLMAENSNIVPISEKIIHTNDKEGFVFTMIPLLIVLASYIGAMLISQHLQLAETKLNIYERSELFVGRQFINVLVAIAISLLTVCLMYLFNIEFEQNFFTIWGFQAVLMFSFLALSQLFVMVLGNFGMIFNIALTAAQLVSSGAIVPRELLAPFYQGLGTILPATYGVNSYFSFIYGGGNLPSDIQYLTIIIVSLLVIAIGGQAILYLWRRVQTNE